MGFGLPAAIGAKLAAPNKTVIDIDGDGSFLMTGMEFVTAVQYKVGVKVLLLNNNFQGMVRQVSAQFCCCAGCAGSSFFISLHPHLYFPLTPCIPLALLALLSLPHPPRAQWQDLFYKSRYSGTVMYNPDFAKLAEAMGGKGLTVEKEEDVESVIKEFLEADPTIPTILNAVCEADEHVYPMVPAGHGLHEMVLERATPPQ